MVYCKKHNIWKMLIVLTQYIVTRMKIIKRSGAQEDFSVEKILVAVT